MLNTEIRYSCTKCVFAGIVYILSRKISLILLVSRGQLGDGRIA